MKGNKSKKISRSIASGKVLKEKLAELAKYLSADSTFDGTELPDSTQFTMEAVKQPLLVNGVEVHETGCDSRGGDDVSKFRLMTEQSRKFGARQVGPTTL